MIEWTTDSFAKDVLDAERLALVLFYRLKSPSSEQMYPVFDELEAKVGSNVLVGKISITAEPELASCFAVGSTPTSAIFADGQLKRSFVGIRQVVELSSAVQHYL